MQPILYQIVHCRHNRPRCLEEHLALLAREYHALWGVRPTLLVEQFRGQLTQLLHRERYSSAVSSFVRIDLNREGNIVFTPLGSSLYDGYALRSIRPNACTLPYEIPFDRPYTSAAEAAYALAEECARSQGFEAAVRCDREGVCYAVGAAQLFAIGGGVLYTSLAPYSVEAKIITLAAERLRLRLDIHPLKREELQRYEELFTVDHRGITSLAHCDGHPFMALRTERLAEAMELCITAR